jgi:hypothetical protein
MHKYGIDAAHVLRHYDVTAKWCPRPWMGDDINAFYRRSGNQMWAEFKASLEAEEVEIKIITVDMNGKSVPLRTINVSGNNFVSLRDLADADPNDAFKVDWNAVAHKIEIDSK